MRRVLRWLLIIGLLVGITWGLTAVPIRGRTAFGHARMWWKKTDPVTVVKTFVLARYAAWFGDDAPKPPAKPKVKAKAKTAVKKEPARPVEEAATAKRVAALEAATRVLEQKTEVRGAPARTRVDERLSLDQKKALDELVTSRVPRR